MSVIGLISAKGSPGVTTTSVGLAVAWAGAVPGRRCLAIDADPSGGDTSAGVLRGSVPAQRGMLALATSRGMTAPEAIDAAAVALDDEGSARLIPGVPDAARAAALPLAWDRIVEGADGLDEAGTDVLVDGGRHDLSRTLGPWLAEADLVVLLVRPTLPAVAAANRLATAWCLPDSITRAVALRVLVVESPSPYGAVEVAAAVGVPLLGVLPHEPEHARVFSDGVPPGRGFARSGFVRGLSRVARDLSDQGRSQANAALEVPVVLR
jgi:MinD-like ATPase involved in chromosome partitioning or flagellar assembly